MKVGLALCGGGAKGSFEIGALRYLYEYGFFANIVCGTSAGSLNVINLAAGGDHQSQVLRFKEVEDIWLNQLNYRDDFYVEAPWLAQLDPKIRELLDRVGKLTSFSSWGPARVIRDLATGLAMGGPFFFLTFVADELVEVGLAVADLVSIVDALKKEPRLNAFFSIAPVKDKLAAVVKPDKIRDSGVQLRLSVANLETGKLRYVTEGGALVEADGTPVSELGELSPITVDLIDGALASSAIPCAFPPVQLGHGFYTDGGVRRNLPILTALELGADTVVAISLTPILQSPDSSFENKNAIEIAMKSVLGMMHPEIERSHVEEARLYLSRKICLIAPRFDVHDTLTVDPGLLRINMDYGYMRTADILANRDFFDEQAHDRIPVPQPLRNVPVPRPVTRAMFVEAPLNLQLEELTDAIIRCRMLCWEREFPVAAVRFGDDMPFRPSSGRGDRVTLVPNPDALDDVRTLKSLIYYLVKTKQWLSPQTVPMSATEWYQNWERHQFEMFGSPWGAFSSRAGERPASNPDGPLLVMEESSVDIYLIIGPERRLVTSEIGLQSVVSGVGLDSLRIIPDGLIGALPAGAPIDGPPMPSPRDILPGNPVAQGQWASIRDGHELVPMRDGRVLDWIPATGEWRLWKYLPINTSDVFPEPPIAQGRWSSVGPGHILVPMIDGCVLDWVPVTGNWRLWTYDPASTADVLPSLKAEGQWSSVREGHELIPMNDGNVLDWIPGTGNWRLWKYSPQSTADVLPALIAEGQWGSIRENQVLLPMADHHVLDWVPASGKWRLWEYDPQSTTDILPGSAIKGWWASVRTGHKLVRMLDGRVLDWVPSDGSWRLWRYDPAS